MIAFTKTKHVPLDMYVAGDGHDEKSALSFSREKAPQAFVAVMIALQDRIADGMSLVSAMATAKEPGFLAHASGQLNALQELWDYLEQRRIESSKLS